MIKALENLQAYAEALVEDHHIPAVSLAVWHNSQLHEAAAGTLNVSTGVKATRDSIFQIGSITKLFTASLIMQLQEEGKIELDTPVKSYLRDFRVADSAATEQITVRQLLNHSNGISGDYFPEDEDWDNAIARYIDRINLLPLVHKPGQGFSYSNAGYVVAGRIIEVVTGTLWDQAMAERIFQPLGMNHAIASPKEVLRYRSAMGHVPSPTGPGQWMLAPNTFLSPSQAPAGSTTMMSAADVLTFARAHLYNDKAAATNWLSAQTLHAMQEPELAQLNHSEVFSYHRGLGWGLQTDRRSDTRLIGHAGSTGSQVAMLRLFPEQSSAFVVLLNSASAGVLETAVSQLTLELAGIDCSEPAPSVLETGAVDLEPYTGIYESLGGTYHVVLEDGAAEGGHLIMLEADKSMGTKTLLSLQPLGKHNFAVFTKQGERLPDITFLQSHDNDKPTHLFSVGRLIPRR